MTRVPSAELHVGYDLAVRIHPSSYAIERDVQGRAWAFTFTEDARDALEDAVRRAFDGPTPGEIAVEPGYVRARFPSLSHTDATGSALLSDLRDAAEIYNRQAPDGEEVRFHPDGFAATFVPDGAPTTEEIRERLAERADPATPEADGPVWAYERDDAGEAALSSDKRLAIRAFIPFDTAQLYDPAPSRSATARSLPVTWDSDAVRDRLREIAEDLIPWPGDARESIPRVAVYPGWAEIDVYRGVAANPAALAGRARDALAAYSRHPPIDERAPANTTMKHPSLAFRGPPLVLGLEHDRTAEAWIHEHDLQAVDGEPHDPDAEGQEDGDAGDGLEADGGRLKGLNPFDG